MKHLKIIGLALVAATALMAFAGSASAAPTLTSPAGTAYTGHYEYTLSGTSMLIKTISTNITCTGSTITGSFNTNNTTHASGSITTLDYTGCSGTVHPLINIYVTYGSLTINQKGEMFGFNVRITTLSTGVHCVYGTGSAGTRLGTLTGEIPARVTISAALPLLEGSAFACGSTGTWSGSYTVTKPGTLFVA